MAIISESYISRPPALTWGQDAFKSVLQQIESNSVTLQALHQQMEADKLQNSSVEYRYRSERMELLLAEFGFFMLFYQ